MVFKFTKPEDKKEYLYRCKKCGEEDWYSTERPDHMMRHVLCHNILRKCGGKLVLINVRSVNQKRK